jgi:hypothetical protein
VSFLPALHLKYFPLAALAGMGMGGGRCRQGGGSYTAECGCAASRCVEVRFGYVDRF